MAFSKQEPHKLHIKTYKKILFFLKYDFSNVDQTLSTFPLQYTHNTLFPGIYIKENKKKNCYFDIQCMFLLAKIFFIACHYIQGITVTNISQGKKY